MNLSLKMMNLFITWDEGAKKYFNAGVMIVNLKKWERFKLF